ncbi:MAG TPA: methyltransferase domain-containing protein [Chthonomonadaceae bacterium]|nr:methyltransferase domain-containing protein [Chthonomonadaceae bacterium]
MIATDASDRIPAAHALFMKEDDESVWAGALPVRWGTGRRLVPLTNFVGRNYPTGEEELMTRLLGILPGERVLEIGGSGKPFARADAVAGPGAQAGRAGVPCPIEALPFAEGEFDLAYCVSALERALDPATACREMMRVARRGFVETPSPVAEYLGGDPASRWLVWVERLPGTEPTLVFRRKPFRRAPFRHALRPRWHTDEDFRFRWERQFRNLMYTQFAWEGTFAFRVEDDPDGFDYEVPAQAAEAHLDSALNGLRFGGIPGIGLLADVDRAVVLCPDWAIAHNTRGCALWQMGRKEEALAAFAEAGRLEPERREYAYNARLRASAVGSASAPYLVLLPPPREDQEDIESNFAGKVYYAFVSFDDRLAQDMAIRPGERVLDVGGGQRPLRRADVSVDFDVFEGLHRQGQAISREKPLVCGDVQRLPFRDRAFDVACCRMVLEHVPDPAAACRELQRVARRGFLETPNTFWESFYGHPTHRWLIEWEAPTRTLVFRRKPFDAIPFKSAIVPLLYTQRDVQRAFEITFRNITTVQVTWDEAHPFSVRVEDDPECPYDYLGRPEDATRGSLNYARDLLESGLAPVAVAEAEDALRHAPNRELRAEALHLRLRIAQTMGDAATAEKLRARLREEQTGSIPSGPPTPDCRLPAPLIWQAPLRDPSGYADEARHFLFALEEAGIEVAARPIKWSEKIAVLPAERERILQWQMARPLPKGAIHVCHILAPYFQRLPEVRANVGRTMFETDRLPAGWAAACSQMDAVWVPGEFNRETFARAGVPPEKLRIVPGAIDLKPYDPACPPLRINGARGFNFLSVFDWTLRKGWDVLIRAFVEEFRPDEDVALLIKTHSSLGYTIGQIADTVAAFLTDTLGRDPNRIPDIIFQDANIPDARMPNLYRAADCYVMPTRGEGWGRPFMEAMALGLPVIATGWSGQTAFMNAENSLLLDYELVDVPEIAWRETPTYRGHRWAEPSVAHLRALMRRAFADREGGREIGQRARADLEAHFTYPAVAQILAEELQHLA